MHLRTVIGAHAGEIRDYAYMAAQAALRDGTAEPVTVVPVLAATQRSPEAEPVRTEQAGRRRAGRRE